MAKSTLKFKDSVTEADRILASIAKREFGGCSVAKGKTRYKGKMFNTNLPTDIALWEEVCYQFTRHIVERYGLETVSQWYLQCFNEPDIPQYFMKHETDPYVRVAEYLKLYRGFSNGICRVSKQLKAGGPALAHNLVFLTEFLLFL